MRGSLTTPSLSMKASRARAFGDGGDHGAHLGGGAGADFGDGLGDGGVAVAVEEGGEAGGAGEEGGGLGFTSPMRVSATRMLEVIMA